ncbi:hypothetical protein GGR57DRAFT_511591 [Xylariaceae sp. FL1272]|nr:hypothetical protein GGR57DRAFT_511591 [Xylariaceae sp. FL1272]
MPRGPYGGFRWSTPGEPQPIQDGSSSDGNVYMRHRMILRFVGYHRVEKYISWNIEEPVKENAVSWLGNIFRNAIRMVAQARHNTPESFFAMVTRLEHWPRTVDANAFWCFAQSVIFGRKLYQELIPAGQQALCCNDLAFAVDEYTDAFMTSYPGPEFELKREQYFAGTYPKDAMRDVKEVKVVVPEGHDRFAQYYMDLLPLEENDQVESAEVEQGDEFYEEGDDSEEFDQDNVYDEADDDFGHIEASNVSTSLLDHEYDAEKEHDC